MKLKHIAILILVAAAIVIGQQPQQGSGAGSDTTSVSNSGASGASVLKTGTNVTARKFVAGSNVTVTENTDDITIASTASGGTAGTDYPKPSLYDTYATVSAATCGATETGRLGFLTDSVLMARCSGSAWQWFHGTSAVSIIPTSGWTTINGSTETFDTSKGYGYLSVPSAAADSVRARVRSVSAPWTLTAKVRVTHNNANYSLGGICVTDGTKLVVFGIGSNGGSTLLSYYHATATTGGSLRGTAYLYSGGEIWLRVADNNTNRILSYSVDGLNWIQYSTTTRTTDVTPTQAGIFQNSANSALAQLTVYSFLIN